MDPTQGHHFPVELDLEKPQFVCHEAMVDVAFLPGDDQGVYKKVTFFGDLSTCQDATGFYIPMGVRSRYVYKSLENLQRTVYCVKRTLC